MNLYHCMIDLKEEAKALGFAKAVDDWMGHLQRAGMIRSWRLMRRKLNLAAEGHRDFLLEIEVEDIAQLDRAFRFSGGKEDEIERMYRRCMNISARARSGSIAPSRTLNAPNGWA